MKEGIKEEISEINEDALFADGFEEALIGVCYRFGTNPLATYNKEKIFEILMRDGMNYDEAVEYFEYNIIGSWVGENTPVFLDILN